MAGGLRGAEPIVGVLAGLVGAGGARAPGRSRARSAGPVLWIDGTAIGPPFRRCHRQWWVRRSRVATGSGGTAAGRCRPWSSPARRSPSRARTDSPGPVVGTVPLFLQLFLY